MDPLSAIGVASSVVQFLDFGFKVATRLKEYNSAATDVPKSLRHISVQLPLLLNALERVRTSIEVERIDLDTRCILKGVVSGCKQQVEKMDKLIDKVLPVPGESLVTRMQKVVGSIKNDPKVLGIEKSLQTYIQVLILHHVIESQDCPWPTIEDPGIFKVPVKKATPFFERKELMQRIETIINPAVTSQASSPIRIILSGKEGAGKTQLAVEYCHQVNTDGRYQTILWTTASTPESLCRSLESISDVIRRSKEGLKDRHAKIEFVKSFLYKWWHPWLLVLDDFVPSEFQNVMDYLPSEGSGAILFTSRSRSFSDHDQLIEVPRFLSPDEIEDLRSRMISAVDTDNVDIVEILLADGADPNCRGIDGEPCLDRAVEKSYTNMVKLLLTNGASSRQQTEAYGYINVLERAALRGNIDITRMLLDCQDAAGLSPKPPGNSTALLEAARGGHEDTVRTLIEHGSVDIAFRSIRGETAMGAAAEKGRTAVVTMLLSHGANANDKSKGEAPLTWATRNYHLETMKVLIKGKAHVNAADFTFGYSQPPLWHALAGCYGAFQRSMDRASDDMVEYLLKSGADVNIWDKRNSSPLQEAAIRGRGNAVRMLLGHGADAYPTEGEGKDDPPIVKGAVAGSESVMKLLLEAEAKDITARDRQRELALIHASMRGKRDMILLLLEKDVNIDTGLHHGQCPLISAIDKNQIPTARLLIRRGARVDKSDEYGRLPLLIAAEKGLDVVVKEIMEKTKNPDVQNAKGDTALCVAAAKGHGNVVKVLLEKKADRDLANKFGDTPLDLAVEGHHKKVAEMLE